MRSLRAITAVLVMLLVLATWPGPRAGRIEAGASGRGAALPTGLQSAMTQAGLRSSATTLTQQAELAAGDATQLDSFGLSVALSGDGGTALVGADGKNASTGAAYVFVRNGTTWTQQAELTAGDAAQRDYFGFSTALSQDGSTALVGAFEKNASIGAAYVFVRSGTTWTQQAELTAGDATLGNRFGSAAALAGDGSTALVGAGSKNTGTGAAYVFVRSGTTWTQQAELTAGDAAQHDYFGFSAALSRDGGTALVGAEDKNTSSGAAYVFVLSGTTWTQQAELTAGDAAQGDTFGSAVALAGNGRTALVGALGKNSYTGAAYVFARGGTTWTQQAELTAGDAAPDDWFGSAAALSQDGSTALAGAWVKNSFTGAAYVFVLSGTSWTQQAELTAGDAAQGDHFGVSAALSRDGRTALVGADGKNASTGAAYVYAAGGVGAPPRRRPRRLGDSPITFR
jgi:hypothetical protein